MNQTIDEQIGQRSEQEVALVVLEKLRSKLMERLAELQADVDALSKTLDIFAAKGKELDQ